MQNDASDKSPTMWNSGMVGGAILGAGAGLLALAGIAAAAAIFAPVGTSIFVGFGILAAPIVIGAIAGAVIGGKTKMRNAMREQDITLANTKPVEERQQVIARSPAHEQQLDFELPPSGSEKSWRQQILNGTTPTKAVAQYRG
jgi:hypothetical protein